ncbi:hypothetical protein SAMN05428996_1465 [Quadrisphaera sp. DSM 44207]|nr:hypothetical protein SAMN05428996_1465 [Quadrisphaera sp. DSM 44207]
MCSLGSLLSRPATTPTGRVWHAVAHHAVLARHDWDRAEPASRPRDDGAWTGLAGAATAGPILDGEDPLCRGVQLLLCFYEVAAHPDPDPADGKRALAATGYALDRTSSIEDLLDLDAFSPLRQDTLAGQVPQLGAYRTHQVPTTAIADLNGPDLGPLPAADRLTLTGLGGAGRQVRSPSGAGAGSVAGTDRLRRHPYLTPSAQSAGGCPRRRSPPRWKRSAQRPAEAARSSPRRPAGLAGGGRGRRTQESGVAVDAVVADAAPPHPHFVVDAHELEGGPPVLLAREGAQRLTGASSPPRDYRTLATPGTLAT